MNDSAAPLIELRDVSRRFGGVVALADVSLDVLKGEVHALVGENGAGKSTLINVIAGLVAPDSGELRFDGRPAAWAGPMDARRHGIVTVHQEADLFGTLSVAENMALEQGLPTYGWGLVSWRAVYQRARRAVSLLGEPIDVAQPAARLGVAQRHMTEIAAAVLEQARVLVLDEPTSALTAREAAWLFAQIERLKAAGVGVVYVSHRQEEIFQLADRITVLRDGRNVWSGPRAAIDRAGLIGHMVGRQRAAEMDMARPRPTRTPGPTRLQVDCLADGSGHCADVSLSVRGGEVLGIYGLVGSGRSEFARTLFGLERAAHGSVRIDGRACSIRSPSAAVAAGLAYLSEDRLQQGVFRGLSIRANAVVSTLRSWGVGPLASVARERSAVSAVVERLAIKCRDVEQPIVELSGGNQQKVMLARWLLAEPGVLVLDEPTRGVDVGAKAEIHRLIGQLAERGAAIVLISSDLPEVLENADRVVVFRQGRVAGEFLPRQTSPETIVAAALPQGPAAAPGDEPAKAHDGDAPLGRAPVARSGRTRRAWPRLALGSELALAAAIAALFATLAATNDSFLSGNNLSGLASSAAMWIILSLGAAVVIMVGGIDISSGSLLALSAAVGGLVLKFSWPGGVAIAAAAAAALAVGTAGGLANATLSLWGRVHPIVVTLGTMTIYRGLLIALTGGDTITDLPPAFVALSTDGVLGINGAVAIGAATALAAWLWLGHFRSGRHLIAYGSSPTAARLVGISRWRAWLSAFGVGGLLAALAGLVELSQTGAMQSGMGTGYELRAISAAVIGGVSIAGGRGSVIGVCLGALLLALIYNALVLWEISRYQYSLVTGSLLLAAILADLAWRRFQQ